MVAAVEIEILDEIIEDLNGVQDAMADGGGNLIDHLGPVGRFDRSSGGGGRFDRSSRPSGGRFDRSSGGGGRFDRSSRPSGGRSDRSGGRFDRSSRPSGGRYDRNGGGGGFDRSSRPSGGRSDSGGGRFDRSSRPSGGRMIEITTAALIDHLGLAADVLTETMTVDLITVYDRSTFVFHEKYCPICRPSSLFPKLFFSDLSLRSNLPPPRSDGPSDGHRFC